jgi:hypothetical protein
VYKTIHPAGRIYAVKRRIENNKQLYLLTYCGDTALDVIKKLKQHLVRKRIEAEVAVRYERTGWMGVHPVVGVNYLGRPH